MKKTVLTTIFINLLFLQNIAYAEHTDHEVYEEYPNEYYDTARVVSVKPVVERLYAPSNKCRHPSYRKINEQKNAANDDQLGKLILGGILGGVAGSAVGKGRGQDAASALGAIIGAKIATGGEFTGEQILGAIAGGVIGNQVGGGSGRTAATAVGALAGTALAGGLVSRDKEEFTRTCGDRVVSKRVITSYDVELEYNGYIMTRNLLSRPGNYVDVAVVVEVLDEY